MSIKKYIARVVLYHSLHAIFARYAQKRYASKVLYWKYSIISTLNLDLVLEACGSLALLCKTAVTVASE